MFLLCPGSAIAVGIVLTRFQSGVCACLVNLSGFYIIDAAGPVSSTVIGQLKTCVIVGLGWASSAHVVMRQSIMGIMMALIGMAL